MKKLIWLMILGVIFFIGGQWIGLSFSEGDRASQPPLQENPKPPVSPPDAQIGSASVDPHPIKKPDVQIQTQPKPKLQPVEKPESVVPAAKTPKVLEPSTEGQQKDQNLIQESGAQDKTRGSGTDL